MLQKLKNIFVFSTAWAVMLFLYLPLFIIILYSFNNESVNAFPISSYSLKWYHALFSDDELIAAVFTSFKIAFAGTFIALLIGMPAAYAINKYSFWGKKALERIILMPITLPGIVTGVAMLSFFPFFGINISLTAVMIGHVTFLCAVVITQLLVRFKQLDPFLEQAAYDLGAKPLSAFFKVILPNMKTAIFGTILLCLVLSMDEIPVTFFLIGGSNTLPIEIYGMMRRGITPEVNAISTFIFIFSALAIVISTKTSAKKNN